MITEMQSERRQQAVDKLATNCDVEKPELVVDSLMVGLTHVRNLLLVRTQDDVQRKYGTDSMLGGSFAHMERQLKKAKVEVEAYSCVVVADQVSLGGYLNDQEEWFLDWLFRLRLGSEYKSVFDKRVPYYASQDVEERRLKFVSVLQRVIPESARAPLVLYRLFPRSVRILAAVAFGARADARTLRDEQFGLLPAIRDCHECHGWVLENDEICRCCGNPLWNFAWLLSD